VTNHRGRRRMSDRRLYAKIMASFMWPPIAVAIAAVLLPTPGVLVAPLILATGWVTRRVVNRRLDRNALP
jgi:hypothetical protein